MIILTSFVRKIQGDTRNTFVSIIVNCVEPQCCVIPQDVYKTREEHKQKSDFEAHSPCTSTCRLSAVNSFPLYFLLESNLEPCKHRDGLIVMSVLKFSKHERGPAPGSEPTKGSRGTSESRKLCNPQSLVYRRLRTASFMCGRLFDHSMNSSM